MWAGLPGNRGLISDQDRDSCFLHNVLSATYSGSTGIVSVGDLVDGSWYHSPSPSAYVNNTLIYTTTPSCAFIWWCFIRHMEGWTLYVVFKIGPLF